MRQELSPKQYRKTPPGRCWYEHFKNAAGHLKMIDPQAVLKRYGGEQAEAEKALLCVFHLANKGLAHTTQDLKDHPEQGACWRSPVAASRPSSSAICTLR